MNGDLSNNRQREKDLVAELRSLLHDHPDLPPDHELLRWIHATSVKWCIFFNRNIFSVIFRETSCYRRPCTGRVFSGGQADGWRSYRPGHLQRSSDNITPGDLRVMTRTTAQFGSSPSAQPMSRVWQLFSFYSLILLWHLGILRGAGKDDFIDFTIHIVETSLALMRKKSLEDGSSSVTQHVFIFDLEGFSLAVKYLLKECT